MKSPDPGSIADAPGHVFWLFGLSGAGKTTLASLLAADLRQRGRAVLALDGDIMRAGLCTGLGFSEVDRTENLRRAAEVARLGLASNLCVVAAFITPLAAQRRLVSGLIGTERVSLVWVNAPLATCQSRDVKGLYARASNGAVPQMTGVGASFESPTESAFTLDTANQPVGASAALLRRFACSRLGLPD